MKERIAAIVTCTIVAAGIVLAFIVIGPPGHARSIALDKQRVTALDNIVVTIANNAASPASRAPKHLDVNAPPWFSKSATRDPVTNKPYEYRVLGPRRYRLCATFALPDEGPDSSAPFDNHPAGRVCRNFHF